MPPEPEEPVLPYTPSNTGRRARVGYLGFDGVGFNDLWPLFAGLILSIALALRFFVADRAGGHWLPRTLVAALPFACGFGYLRFLVVRRPPHFKGDLWEGALRLRLDFTDPPVRGFPVVPRIFVDQGAALGPGRAAGLRHPMDDLGTLRRSR
jgi:hypothetical protein